MILPVSMSNLNFKSARSLPSMYPQNVSYEEEKQHQQPQKNKKNFPWALNLGLAVVVLGLLYLAGCLTPDACKRFKPPRT